MAKKLRDMTDIEFEGFLNMLTAYIGDQFATMSDMDLIDYMSFIQSDDWELHWAANAKYQTVVDGVKFRDHLKTMSCHTVLKELQRRREVRELAG